MTNSLPQQMDELGIPWELGVPLARFTSLRVGGAAELLATPTTSEQVAALLKLATENSLPVLTVGRGTNLLIGDKGFRGLALVLDEKLLGGRIEIDGEVCLAAAGLKLTKVVKQLCTAGLGGLEDLYGIPGSLGGALTMNAGSYGSEIMPVVEEIELALPTGEVLWLKSAEIEYGYRRVNLPPGAVITQARLRLEKADSATLLATCKARQADREQKHPLTKPNCGSVFKNPSGEHGAWWLVNEAGLKGYRLGGAQVSTKHTNFIVNTGNATAADILALIQHIQKTVRERFSTELETEVRTAGEF